MRKNKQPCHHLEADAECLAHIISFNPRTAHAKTLRQKRAKSNYVAIVPGSCLQGTVQIKSVLHPERTWVCTARESSTSEGPLSAREVSQIGQSF